MLAATVRMLPQGSSRRHNGTGRLTRWGIEGTSSYRAGPARAVLAAGLRATSDPKDQSTDAITI
jgi:hypothetical protein